jgi:chromosome segregation ATPase
VIIIKKILLVLLLALIFAFPNVISGQQGQQNQNQINTQNTGEEKQLQVTTQEQENLGEQKEGLQTRNQAAVQNMSIVAQKVQELLQTRTSGGIGEQVRKIAQEQDQAQTQIQEQINKIESRKDSLKSLIGSDFGAIKNLERLLEQNRLRIQELEQLQNQLVDNAELTTVQETIQALVQENTSLQELINTEEKTASLFGWLFRLFVR